MSEQPSATHEADSISQVNKAIYSQYKQSVDRAEKRKAWLEDKTFKGVTKRAVNEAVKTLLVQSPSKETNDDLNAPFDAAEDARRHLNENEEAVKQDAIHDATAAGVGLNLPESGLPETATNVQPIPTQEQKNS